MAAEDREKKGEVPERKDEASPPEMSEAEKERALNARGHFDDRLSENTRKTYRRGWDDFCSFCEEKGEVPLPADSSTIVHYINERFGKHAPKTIRVRLSAIRFVHEEAEEDDPTRSREVRGTLQGIEKNSEHTPNKAEPLLTRHIKQMVDALREERPDREEMGDNRKRGDRLRSLRDEAVLLFGYAGALRRSEIAAVEKQHLVDRDSGYALLIPESKTDQAGEGQYIGISRTETEYCPCAALEQWLEESTITSGPLFRGVHWRGAVLDDAMTGKTVANLIENAAEKASLSFKPSGHSLRAGHITQATINGVPDGVIRAQSRHEDPGTFYGYQRVHKALDESSSQHLDL